MVSCPQPGESQNAGNSAKWGVLALIAVVLFSFCSDWSIVNQGGSIDYRNRVTGARLLAAGRDPYFYKWQYGDRDRWCDIYDNPKLPITKTTVSPAVLLVSIPVAALPYRWSQWAWLIGQWGLLAGLCLMWALHWRHRPREVWWWVAIAAGFTCTLAWRHHVDRGQTYILFAFLFGLWMRMSLAVPPHKSWLWGLLAGFLVCLRPPLLLFTGPFILFRRRAQWMGATVGLLLGLILPMVLRPAVWADYGRAMTAWSEIYRDNQNPRPGAKSFPSKIEGMPLDLLSTFKVRQYADSSLHRLFRGWGWSGVSDKAVLALLVIPFGIWCWRYRRASDPSLLLGMACWAFLSDAFLPAYRNPYNDVMLLNVIALLPVLGTRGRVQSVLALLAVGLGVVMVNILPPSRWWIYLPTLAAAAVSVAALLRIARNDALFRHDFASAKQAAPRQLDRNRSESATQGARKV